MEVIFQKLPRKAQSNNKKKTLRTILNNAEDKLYLIIKIDYSSGLIRFESLQHDNLFINLYVTSYTVTIENREEGEKNNQFHFRNHGYQRIKRMFNNPKKFIYESIT